MKKVFLDVLPMYEEGTYKGRIDWSNTIGMWVGFVYNDIYGKMQIIRYDKKSNMLTIRYEDREMDIKTGHFSKCQLGKLLGTRTNEFKVEMGQVFKNNNGRDLTIIDRKYIKSKNGQNCKYYKYKCNKCRFDGNTPHYKNRELKDECWIEESALLTRGTGCSCCCSFPQIVVEGINDITTTAPWMIDLGVDKEEAKKFTCQSSWKIKVKCPHCNNIMYKQCNNIYRCKSIGCSNCGDGISYISKYVYSVLKQLNIKFDTEVKYEWNKYINPLTNKESQASIDYVIYHNGREIPIEADGSFHRTDNHMNGQTKEMSQYIDKQRDDNCLEFLNEETIRISDEGDVRENILNSKLKELFDLSLVDWLKCDEYALTNRVKEVCDYWNNKDELEVTKDLAKVFGVSCVTIIRYLNQGVKLGWCDYDAKEENRKASSKSGKRKGKKVEIFNLNNKSLGVFSSGAEVERQSEELFGVKLLNSKIYLVCVGKQKSHKGYIFKYV